MKIRPAISVATAIFLSQFLLAAAAPQSSVIYFERTSDSFSATGNWIPADPKQKPAFPSETEIDCFKNGLTCYEAIAEFYMGHPHVSTNFYQIIKWDRDGIIATDSSGTCMAVTLQITFAEKRIAAIRTMKELDADSKKVCNNLGIKETVEDSFVLKGSERWNKEHSFLPEKPSK